MTCKEKLRQDHPEMSEFEFGLTIGSKCPRDFGYPEDPARYCRLDTDSCTECWDQPYTLEEATDAVVDSPAVQAWIEHMEEKESRIKDSGNRREFETGAVRDMQEGKGRCDLMPLEVVSDILASSIIADIKDFLKSDNTNFLYSALSRFAADCYGKDKYYERTTQIESTMLLEVAKHFEEGAKKYGENNWQKGIPPKCYIDSAVRHYLKWLRGDKDEPHDRAFCWNLMCCIWEVDYREKEENKK